MAKRIVPKNCPYCKQRFTKSHITKFHYCSIWCRFWSKVLILTQGECWQWTSMKRNGYGRFRLNDKLVTASRLAWILIYGPIPGEIDVLHKCDNPSCVNPMHLFLGTHSDNMRDSASKGRHKTGCHAGELCPTSKLHEHDIIEIRSLLATGLPQSIIAKTFNVCQSNISVINRKKTWAHIG